MMRIRPIVPAAMVYAVAPTAAVIMGDTLMYVVLPVAAVEFGAGAQHGLSAAFWIGLALSINRFVRLVSNSLAATVCQWLGVRWPFVCSIILGALTTLAYGLGSGLIVLLLARAAWGVAYSCMRLAAHLTAFGVGTSDMRGRLMGFFNSGQRSGSLIAVTAGALLYQLTSKEVTFTVMAGVGLLGVLTAMKVPDLRPERVRPNVKGLLERLNAWDLAVSRLPGYGKRLRLPLLSICLVAFAVAFAANGLAIATVAPYIAEFADENGELFGGPLAVVTLSGVLVGLRWASDLGLGVPLGHLSDRMGRRRSIAYGMLVMLGSLALMASVDSVVAVIVGMPLLFASGVGVGAALDAAMGETSTDSTRAAAMGRYATWHDLGAALGPFAGFLIADRIGFQGGYLVAAVLLAGAWGLYAVATRRR